ncbi:hypothetical protein PQX77_012162 [Marasmius sp. AFHP31]|nr:hypothetical protein PQX77_012162 [Marasmius sp. AFHP31]
MVKRKKEPPSRIHSTSASNASTPKLHNASQSTGSRIKRSKVKVDVKSEPEQPEDNDLTLQIPGGWNWDQDGHGGEIEAEDGGEPLEEEPGQVKVKPKKKKRYEDSDAPLITWKGEHRDEYLDGNMSTEGRGRLFQGTCGRCSSLNAKYRCLDCFGLRMVCKDCLLHTHKDEPLHMIQRVSLKSLGLRVQLGHLPGTHCNHARAGHKDFAVLAWNGLHEVNVDFCGCETLAPHLQLMELGWWPSSYKDPRSAATFNLLRNYHITNLQAQAPPTDFLKALEQITDGSGLKSLPDREAQFLLMLRQWRHIKLAKRCGRCHDPTGVKGTSFGEAAVQCRACPHPNRNLPEGWDKVPKEDGFLHALFLSQDANFKQKARARANDHRDPALGDGWGTFVPNKEYLEEIAKHTDDYEISHCVGFNAIASANSKKSKGLRATGVAAISCARHETFRPNGMGDLQVGERQSNMDFIALFSLIGSVMLLVFLSYNIACQWMRHFRARMSTYPEYMHLPSWMNVIFKVPKFHLPVHIFKCHSPFSFGYTEGAAKTDGEGPERLWSWLNASARSMSMMSAGGRWDTMDDFTGFWNWRKVIGLQSSLVNRLVKVIPEAVVTARAFSAFTEALMDDHAEDLATWQKLVVDWERDQSNFCPYNVPEPKVSMAKIRKDLAEEEHRRELAGQNTPSSTAAGMLIEGIEIEQAQRALVATATKKKLTDFRQETLAKTRTKLLQRIQRYRLLLLQHLPFLRQLLEASPITSESTPETIPLFLPSSFNSELLKICPRDVLDMETQLRNAHTGGKDRRMRHGTFSGCTSH